MGRHLNRAIEHFGTDTRDLLEGGRYALLHTRTTEFDDLRPYIVGDDFRDIDWRATARSGEVLVKRFVTEKHHKLLLVADAGLNMTALAPSGETKRDIATIVMGAVGLIALRRSDEIGMVYGDVRGSVHVRMRRGENHIESTLEQYYVHSGGNVDVSDIRTQLSYVAETHRHRLLLVVVSDEPDVSTELRDVLTGLTARHELLWVAISDMPAIGAEAGEAESYDVATGRIIPDGAALGPAVLAAYRRAEQQRAVELDAFFRSCGVPFVRIAASAEIRSKFVELSEAYRNAAR